MSSKPPQNPTDDSPLEGTAIESLLDRPVAQVARFCGQSAAAWGRGLVDPWGLGVLLARRAPQVRAPFAFLVIALFTTGMALRLWMAIEAVPPSADASLIGDLRAALADVSLARVTLVTLPCVLIVAAGGKLLSLVGRSREGLLDCRVVAAVCYAVGWQALLLAAICMLFIALQLAGFEPAGSLNDEMNQILPFVAGAAVVWGALIVTPSLVASVSPRRWWVGPACFTGASGVTTVVLVGSLWVLGESVDLRSAARLADERQLASWRREADSWMGEIQADVLRWRVLPGASRCEMTVAYTSRTERLVVLPRQHELTPIDSPNLNFRAKALPVVSSSLDAAADRALVIQPGETRVVEYVVESKPMLIGSDLPPAKGSAPYWVEYHSLDRAGYFVKGRTSVLPPREVVFPRLVLRPKATTNH